MPTGVIADLDGNIYDSVIIGTQEWLVQNWKCTKDRNSNVLTTKYPNNSAGNVADYGLLYNWTDAQLLSPAGWHLPSKTEFDTLVAYLGGDLIAGSELKETGTTYWNDNTDATNSTGFTARGAGFNSTILGVLFFKTSCGLQLSTDSVYLGLGDNFNIYSSDGGVDFGSEPKDTSYYSVRLIKDTIPTSATTEPATNITSTSATLNGTVTTGNVAVGNSGITFDYGLTNTYGNNSLANPYYTGVSITPINVSLNLVGLTPSTLYHYRTKVVSSTGTYYGADETFTTNAAYTGSAVTQVAYPVGSTSAKLKGTVTVPEGYGIAWGRFYINGINVSPIITINTPGVHNISYLLTGLEQNTTYSYYCYLTNNNSSNAFFGVEVSFTTISLTPTFKPRVFFV